jgi:hypothetical protein
MYLYGTACAELIIRIITMHSFFPFEERLLDFQGVIYTYSNTIIISSISILAQSTIISSVTT